MGFSEIDRSKKTQKLELWLAKPDGTIISKMKHINKPKLEIKLGNINELTFEIPYQIDIHHELVDNPLVSLVKGRYLIKAMNGRKVEWFIIPTIEDSGGDDSDKKSVTAYSLGYELRDKTLRSWTVDSVNLAQSLMGGVVTRPDGTDSDTYPSALAETNWKVGYVDADFLTKYRSFDESSVTVLDYIFNVAETFNALIVFNTETRTLNFYNPANYGANMGWRIRYGKYLKSVNRKSESDEMVTRFKAFGENDLTFNDQDIAGQNYIEDFSYFMYPFQRDAVTREVIRHSDYMSDSLCHAILDYNALLASKEGEFKGILDRQAPIKDSLDAKEVEMFDAETKLEQIKDAIDVANAKGTNTTALEAQKVAQQAVVDGIQAEIDSLEALYQVEEDKKAELRNSLKIEDNFTPEQIEERNQYIIVKEWTDSSYFDSKELYEEAKKRFEEVKTPKLTIDVNLINFLDIVEAQRDWDKLNIGDTIIIEYERLGIEVTAKITSISIDYEASSIDIQIANFKDVTDEAEKLAKLINQSNSTSTQIDISKYRWNGITNVKNQVDQFFNSRIDATKQAIVGGVNESIELSKRGILVKDPDDPMNYLIIQHGVVAFTNDGGNTWKHALTPIGLIAEQIVGKLIIGEQLLIDSTTDSGGNKIFSVDGNGVTISGMALTITGGLPPEQLDPSFKDSLVEWNVTYTNGIRMDVDNGVVVTRSDGKFRTTMNATYGFKIEKNNAGTWENVFYVDAATSSLMVDNLIANKLILKGNNGKALIDGTTNTIDFTNYNVILGKDMFMKGITVKDDSGNITFQVTTNGNVTIKGSADISGNINMTSGTISWSSVGAPSYSQIGGTKPPTDADNTNSIIGSRLTKITSTGIYTGSIDAYQINTTNLAAEKIYKASAPNNYMVVGGTYSDLIMYYNSAEFFRVYNALDSVSFQYKGITVMNFNGSSTILSGVWDFSGATVRGVTATFG